MPGILGALLAVMLQLAVGLHFAALLTDWRGEVTRGFLALTALTALVVAGLAFALAGLARVAGVERLVQGALLLGLLLYSLLLATPRRARRLPVGLLALTLGLASLVLAAWGRPSEALGGPLTALAYLLSALALGAGVGGMLLGHWYLMTPWLTSRPLRLLCDLLLASLVPLTALAGWYLLLGGGAAGPGGLSGLALWLGAAMITVFPFVVTVAARACCVDGAGRGRSLQAATGLLYLVAAAVLAGGLAGNAVLLGA
jgi:hypothetical protein